MEKCIVKCVIEILDFKNVKLNNLTPETRRKCTKAVTYTDPKARYLPQVRMGRWDGKVSFCSIGGQTYVNLLPKLLEIIIDDGYEIEIEDRRPQINLKFDRIDAGFFSDKLWSGGQFKDTPVILRDHQVNAINALLENDMATIVAATSQGKTIITAALAKQAEKYGRQLTIVPNRDLVDQTYDDFVMLGLDVGKIYHGQKDLNNTHTITTWQSLHQINKKSKEKLQDEEIAKVIDGVVMSIQDETHLATSSVLFDINSKLLRNVPLAYGLTGTIPKEEHLRESIRANFGEIVYQIPAHELQDKGILAKCEIELHQIFVDNTAFSDYHAEKKYVQTHPKALKLIADDAIQLSKSGKGNTLILVENIDTGIILSQMIPDSVFLSGNVKQSDRKKEYKEVADVDDKVIIATYGIASTGISINRLFNLILFNAGKQFTKTIQSIGRGLRVAEDKDFVHIRDYSFNTKYSKRHLSERKAYYKEQKYPFTMIKRSTE